MPVALKPIGLLAGIVPVTCEQLFKQIEAKGADSGIQCQVTFSMIEVCTSGRGMLTWMLTLT